MTTYVRLLVGRSVKFLEKGREVGLLDCPSYLDPLPILALNERMADLIPPMNVFFLFDAAVSANTCKIVFTFKHPLKFKLYANCRPWVRA